MCPLCSKKSGAGLRLSFPWNAKERRTQSAWDLILNLKPCAQGMLRHNYGHNTTARVEAKILHRDTVNVYSARSGSDAINRKLHLTKPRLVASFRAVGLNRDRVLSL